MDIQFVRKDQGLRGLERLEYPPDTGQAVHPLRGVICGHQLGPLPHPADLMEPAPQGLGRDGEPPIDLQGQGQGGTAPARAAPPIRPGRRLEQGHAATVAAWGAAPWCAPAARAAPGRRAPGRALPPDTARTVRYTLEREQNRTAAISVGWRPVAHTTRRCGGPAGSRIARAAARPASRLAPPWESRRQVLCGMAGSP